MSTLSICLIVLVAVAVIVVLDVWVGPRLHSLLDKEDQTAARTKPPEGRQT